MLQINVFEIRETGVSSMGTRSGNFHTSQIPNTGAIFEHVILPGNLT